MGHRTLPGDIHQVIPLLSPLSGTEAFSLCTGRAFPRHSHDHFGFGVMMHGAQRSWSLIGQTEAAAGDIIIVNPGEIHDGVPCDGARSWQMIYLEPALLMRELGADNYRPEVQIQPLVRDPQLRQRLLQLFSTLSESAVDPVAAEESLLLILMQCCQRHLLTARYRPLARQDIRRAKQYLDEVPEQTVSLSELAALCQLSRFQLLRSFSRQVGITPAAYLLQLRVRKARRYLAAGSSIVDAALWAGFADQSHLTRAFSRQMGITPARYQQAVRR